MSGRGSARLFDGLRSVARAFRPAQGERSGGHFLGTALPRALGKRGNAALLLTSLRAARGAPPLSPTHKKKARSLVRPGLSVSKRLMDQLL